MSIPNICQFRTDICQIRIYITSELTYVRSEFISVPNWYMSDQNLCHFRTYICKIGIIAWFMNLAAICFNIVLCLCLLDICMHTKKLNSAERIPISSQTLCFAFHRQVISSTIISLSWNFMRWAFDRFENVLNRKRIKDIQVVQVGWNLFYR